MASHPAARVESHDPGAESPRPGSNQADELALVARIRNGDEGALAAVFHLYYDRLVAHAVRYVRVPAIAEEVIQDLFLAVWRGRDSWELQGGSLATYLYLAARNRALNRVKRQRIEGQWIDAASDTPDPPAFAGGTRLPATDAVALTGDLATAARAAVEGLAPRCREAYVLARQHGLTYGEVAGVMGISEHTVRIQMKRALAALRKQLAPWLG